MQILDNYFSQEVYENLNSLFFGGNLPWYFNEYITNKAQYPDEDIFQFTHTFYRPNQGVESQWCQALQPFFDSLINPGILIRIKANLNPRQTENLPLGQMHIDYDYDCMTAIYYVNTNNGYTKFETGEVIKSVANRLVVFPASTKHVGYSCTDEKARVVLNINYFSRPNV